MSFQNLNICRSFVQNITTLAPLTSQVCSEVIIYNRSGDTIEIYDSNYFDPSNAFILSDGDSFVVRGITNSDQVSAVAQAGGGDICYRTQYYSNFAQGSK